MRSIFRSEPASLVRVDGVADAVGVSEHGRVDVAVVHLGANCYRGRLLLILRLNKVHLLFEDQVSLLI